MHPFIGISLLRLCASGPASGRRRDGHAGTDRSRRGEVRVRRALGTLSAHLRRDIGLDG
jgi:hypothetical protein